jgi:hypothetical protein
MQRWARNAISEVGEFVEFIERKSFWLTLPHDFCSGLL